MCHYAFTEFMGQEAQLSLSQKTDIRSALFIWILPLESWKHYKEMCIGPEINAGSDSQNPKRNYRDLVL